MQNVNIQSNYPLEKNKNSFFKKIFDYFIQGLLFVAPLGVTLYVIVVIFLFIDNIINNYIDKVLPFHIPGAGIIVMFILISLIGWIGHSFFGKPIKLIFEKSLGKAPFIQLVYTSVRDLIIAFVGKEKKFTQPVLVKINKHSEIEMIGFITATDLSMLNIKDKVAVYCPYSYTFMGELLIVPKDYITPLSINGTDAMKFVVSGGISKPYEVKEDKP